MKCYKPDCREECDELKKAYCIFRRTKEQQELIAKIKGHYYCSKCGSRTVKAKYNSELIQLCTNCGVKGEKIA